MLDTALFFSLAFAGTELPATALLSWEVPIWVTWALGDLAVKAGFVLALLIPFRLLLNATQPPPPASAGAAA